MPPFFALVDSGAIGPVSVTPRVALAFFARTTRPTVGVAASIPSVLWPATTIRKVLPGIFVL